ncbi:MAG: hypothetical protein SO119_04800 [Phascolarctobacterium sp.]|nr:hypothetical protein [Phascolarctobacterium sp.]
MIKFIAVIILIGAAYLAYKLTLSAHKQGKLVGCGTCGKGACSLKKPAQAEQSEQK